MEGELFTLGGADWAVLILYAVSAVGLGIYLGKDVKSAHDFYVSSKPISWWAIGLSIIATYISAMGFLGGPAWSYTEGFSTVVLHLNYPIVVFVVVLWFLPFFYNSGVVSIYDYQERRFGPTARTVISVLFLVTQVLGSAAILYVTSLVLQFLTGIDVIYAIVIVAAIALLYTAVGGIAAVIWTDVLQAGMLLIGMAIITVALANKLPLPLFETLQDLKAEGRTNPFDFSLDASGVTTVWSGLIAMTVYHITVYGANQMMVQRTLSAGSIGDAKKANIMAGFVAVFQTAFSFFIGILLYSYFQGKSFDNTNTIMLHFVADVGVPGLMGLISAVVLATAMSSLDSSLNSLSTISTVDFYQRYFRREASPEHYLKVSRISTVIWALLIVIPAIGYTTSSGSILETLSKVGSYTVGAKLSMFAMGFFSKHTTEKGLLVGVVAGIVTIPFVAAFTEVAWPWYCVIGAVVNVLVSWVSSILMDGWQSDWSPYTVHGQKQKFAAEGLEEMRDGWYTVPGKIDRSTYWLLAFMAIVLASLYYFENWIL